MGKIKYDFFEILKDIFLIGMGFFAFFFSYLILKSEIPTLILLIFFFSPFLALIFIYSLFGVIELILDLIKLVQDIIVNQDQGNCRDCHRLTL